MNSPLSRPLAYSMFADTVHHIRGELEPPQLIKILRIYAALMQNPSLTVSIQTVCAKLITTLVESVIANAPAIKGVNDLVVEIFRVEVDKFKAIDFQYRALLAKDETAGAGDSLYVSLEASKPIFGASFAHESVEDFMRGLILRSSHNFPLTIFEQMRDFCYVHFCTGHETYSLESRTWLISKSMPSCLVNSLKGL
jgi:hypothetical protein